MEEQGGGLEGGIPESCPTHPGPEQELLQKELDTIVREAIDHLPPDFWMVVLLAFVPNAYKAMAVFPKFLEHYWQKIKTIRAGKELSIREKEIIALAVSATNGCEYCINAHTAVLKRLGMTDRGIVELMAVVDHYNGLNAFLEGLQIESDIKP